MDTVVALAVTEGPAGTAQPELQDEPYGAAKTFLRCEPRVPRGCERAGGLGLSAMTNISPSLQVVAVIPSRTGRPRPSCGVSCGRAGAYGRGRSEGG